MARSFVSLWAETVVRHRVLVLIASLLVVMGMAYPMKNLYFDTSNEIWFLHDDPSLAEYQFLKETFGSAQVILIGIPQRDVEKSVITKENMIFLNELSSFLEDHQFVDKVSSLSKYQVIQSENDTLNTVDLVEDFDSFQGTDEEIQRIREIMAKEHLVHDTMITKDLDHTIVFTRFEPFSQTPEEAKLDNEKKIVLLTDIRKFLADQGYEDRGYQFYFMGEPYISEQFLLASMDDQMTTFPLMFLLITVFLILSFRSIPGLVGPWIIIIASAISMLGVIGLMQWPMNMLNAMLPILLVVVGIGDSVHLIMAFYHAGNKGMDSKQAAVEATKHMMLPCFYTTVTTFIGFLAISVTRLAPLREYGMTAGTGVVFALLFSVTTLPAFLSFVSAKGKRAENLAQSGMIAQWTSQLTPFTYKYRHLLFGSFSIIVMASLYWASKIEVDSNFLKSFREGSQLRVSTEYFDETFNGGLSLEFVFDSGVDEGVKDPQFLREVLKFQNYAESLPNTGRANSLVNYLRKMNQTMHNEDPAHYTLPTTRELVAQYLFLYTSTGPEEDLSDLKSFDERYLRLSLRIPNMSTVEMTDIIEGFKEYLKVNHPNLTVTVTGDMVLWSKMGSYIQDGLVKSFSLALVAILICFFLLFRSVKYGLLALIPSVTPILIAGGVMGMFEIYLDFATMIIAAVTFGIAVDDTIHVMSRFINARRRGESLEDAMHEALTESGRAVVFTSIILSCGFSILMLSTFMMNVYFGLLGTIIIMIALFADLVILPAAVFLFRPKA